MASTLSQLFWTGFGGTGVASQIREAVSDGLEEFEALKLNPIDEMVASYGRALRVLSQNWPVLDGDEPVGPIRAMNEASRVVAENQIRRITAGRIQVADLSPEAAMALTLYGIFGIAEFAYDDALNLSKSLNIGLEGRTGGYNADGRFIGINTQASGAGRRAARTTAEDSGFHAPLIRKGSKLRLARPGERHKRRLEHPQNRMGHPARDDRGLSPGRRAPWPAATCTATPRATKTSSKTSCRSGPPRCRKKNFARRRRRCCSG